MLGRNDIGWDCYFVGLYISTRFLNCPTPLLSSGQFGLSPYML
jgi:hypothetical protein